jgi:adenine deaminase
MNRAVKAIVSEGVDPITAIQMATINVARAYGVDHRIGSIAPGRKADMVLVSDLKDFDVEAVRQKES